MPKQFINLAGAVIVAAILAVAIGLVALPLYLQSVAVHAQAVTVAGANDVQQAAVDALVAKEADLPGIQAQTSALEAQIPSSERFDTVSALIAEAAADHGVTVASFTPIEASAFGAAVDANAPAATSEDAVVAVTGRVQLPVVMDVSSPSLGQLLDFLDELRAGPRLLGGIEPQIFTDSSGAQATINALAFATIAEGQE